VQYEELDIPQGGPRALPPVSSRARGREADAMPRMAVVAGIIAGVLLLGFAGASLFHRSDGPPPIIRPDPRPMRVKPVAALNPPETGPNDEALADPMSPQQAALAAPSEAPNPAALRAQMAAEQARNQAAADAAATAAATAARAAADPQARDAAAREMATRDVSPPEEPAPPAASRSATARDTSPDLSADGLGRPVARPPSGHAATPASLSGRAMPMPPAGSPMPPAPRAQPLPQIARSEPLPAPRAAPHGAVETAPRSPAPLPAPHSAVTGRSELASANPSASLPPPTPVPATALAAPPRTAQPTEVQLAAVGSEEAARGEWQRLTGHMPELLGGRHPDISRVARDGRTYWRIRLAGFGDVADASAFCERVRAKGGGCSVASF
jgi:hypothetical protein